MSNIDIIRAWKDEEYRNSLTDEQRSQLPENPAGMVELSNDKMESIKGGQPVSFRDPCHVAKTFGNDVHSPEFYLWGC